MENESQLEELPEDLVRMLNAKQGKWGVRWESSLEKLHKVVTSIQMKFTAAQTGEFKGFFSNFYHKDDILHDFTMVNCLKRPELNAGRMPCVVLPMHLLGKLKYSLTGYPIFI